MASIASLTKPYSAPPNKKIFITFLTLLFVFTFPLLIQIIFSDFVREGEYNSRLGWSLIIMFIGLLTNRPAAIKILLIPFIIGGSIDIGYAISFGGVFTTTTLEAVFNTDTGEAMEYAASYFSLPLISILLFYWLTLLILFRFITFNVPLTKTRHTFLILGLILCITAGYRIAIMQKYHDTIPGFLGSMPSYYKGHMNVQQEILLRQKFIESQTSNKVSMSNKDRSQTYIFLIGESINRNHIYTYGYHRNTTPNITRLENELTVFNDVISSHAQTNASLRLALTEANIKNQKNYRDALSIVDSANMAGFETWWISNQQPIRSVFASISAQADQVEFISNDYQGVETNRYDGFMLPYIQDALNDSAEHKVIFIHMMGSHAQYANRYPPEFSQFDDNNIEAYDKNISQGKIDSINEYDNSIYYTDWIFNQILESLQQSRGEIKALTFFADHGEEIFDQKNIKGHSPDNVTANMVEIPMITWTSEEYNQSHEKQFAAMRENISEGFQLDNFFHFANDLMGISSSQIKQEYSLSSTKYIEPSQRKIYRKSYEQDLRYRFSNTPKSETPKQVVQK